MIASSNPNVQRSFGCDPEVSSNYTFKFDSIIQKSQKLLSNQKTTKNIPRPHTLCLTSEPSIKNDPTNNELKVRTPKSRFKKKKGKKKK